MLPEAWTIATPWRRRVTASFLYSMNYGLMVHMATQKKQLCARTGYHPLSPLDGRWTRARGWCTHSLSPGMVRWIIEETFRHRLGPGTVRGIPPRWEREGVGEPLFSSLFHGGLPGASSLGRAFITGEGFLSLTLRQCLGLPN